MKRALRMHHYYRLKLARKKRARKWDDWYMADKEAASYATTACLCSCFMCGNPRRKTKSITRQENSANMKFLEGCREVDYRFPLSLKQMGRIK